MCSFVGLTGTFVQGPAPPVELLLAIVEGVLPRVDEALTEIGTFFTVIREAVTVVGELVAVVGDHIARVGARLAVVRLLAFHISSLAHDVLESMTLDHSALSSGQRVPNRTPNEWRRPPAAFSAQDKPERELEMTTLTAALVAAALVSLFVMFLIRVRRIERDVDFAGFAR